MFGPVMQFTAGELEIRLAPLARENMTQFVTNGGMQLHSVTRYLGRRTSPVLEDEFDWYERIRNNKEETVWGIYIREGEVWTLIGNTSLHEMGNQFYHGAISGFMIFRPEWWGKGIASHCHRARTMYAFDQMNLTVIRSAVMAPNLGSGKALEKIGYVQVSTERNQSFVDGQWVHQRNFELVNPAPNSWRAWWHGETPPRAFREARAKTAVVLEWAREHVQLQ